ncbi:MAG: heavy metal translocating P-type ATPase [Leptolyngbya sp. PLA3]|nr:MAG: heavy metal translocating P-type ATPase [Cyanobacteria bacterium CYA]MCE7968820.1 heavy metal translocating P-type ATPase [Leptolyngbya sp. PL-A3]
MSQITTKAPRATAAAAAKCTHCGLEVPPVLARTDLSEQFCCQGCETVYRTIHECGLERYYELRDASTNERVRPEVPDHAFAEFDDPAFEAVYVAQQPDGLASVELALEGVHCAACVWLVERLPSVVTGVVESRLNLRTRVVQVRWDPSRVRLSRIADTLTHLGYRPHPARGAGVRQARIRDERRMLARIAIAGFCAGNVMLLAFALYGGVPDGIEPRFETLFRWMSMLIAAVSLAGPGSVFFRGALAALRARAPHLDLPIGLALLIGGLGGTINTIRGSGEIYFDSLTTLVFLLLVGRFIQQRQQRKASDAIELLYAFTPSLAHVVNDDEVRDVPVEALRIGDLIEVRPGELVAADGTLESGHSAIDASLLTGESRPAEVGPGCPLSAGTLNIASPVRLRVESTGPDSRIGRLMRLVADAAERKAPILALTNRIALVFTVVVVVLACVTFGVWVPRGIDQASGHAIALLIVTCPCALGLATPLAMTASIGRAARRGIMIKGSDALERLTHPGVIYLDKTGTVTHGGLTVVQWIGDKAARRLVAALERGSRHPIARALADLDADTPAPDSVEHVTGAGVRGVVEGHDVVVGNADFVEQHVHATRGDFAPHFTHAADEGLTPVAVAVDGRVVALALLADDVRPDSRQVVERLQRAGWTVRLLSGDDPRTTRRIGERIGLGASDIFGGVSPERKLAVVSRPGERTVMVGDGVNDAAALAAAGVGIAVHGGAEASLEASDVYLTRPGLGPILETLDLARGTRRVIFGCLGASLTYNSIAATLAVMGLITPIIAAILMPLSSLTVVLIASRAGSSLREEHR